MKLLASVCGVVAVLTIGCMAAGKVTSPENAGQAKKDMEALQGTWQAIKGPGSPESDEIYKKIKFVVKGNNMTVIDSNPDRKSKFEATFKLNPKTKAFDWTKGEEGWVGIYELKGDDFKFYVAPAGRGAEQDRPKSFADKDGVLFVLKRQKP